MINAISETAAPPQPSVSPIPAPEVLELPKGIEVVLRDYAKRVMRIYYFRKMREDRSGPLIFFHAHTPTTPYVFDACWCFRTQQTLTSLGECRLSDRDRLDKVLYSTVVAG